MKKRFIVLFICTFVFMFGCTQKEKDEIEEIKGSESEQEIILSDSSDQGELPEAILGDAEEKMIPIMSAEELTGIEWDDDLMPYVEYDFFDENEFWDYATMDSNIFISFGDLNLDGQREMMITIPALGDNSRTFIYTIEDGEVTYCGYTIAGRDYTDNSVEFKYWPKNLFDVYTNEQGEFRYFSSDSDWHGNFGSNFIYESTFENNHISCKPVFAMVYSEGDYGYWTEDTWDDWENYNPDDEKYSALDKIISDYMSDYEKVDVPFLYSEYSIPGYARDLEEESQEAIRKNILAGIAQAAESNE